MPWEQHQAIMRQNRDEARRIQTDPPAACPIDGEVLDVRSDGVRNCPLGNYRWPIGGVDMSP